MGWIYSILSLLMNEMILRLEIDNKLKQMVMVRSLFSSTNLKVSLTEMTKSQISPAPTYNLPFVKLKAAEREVYLIEPHCPPIRLKGCIKRGSPGSSQRGNLKTKSQFHFFVANNKLKLLKYFCQNIVIDNVKCNKRNC